MGDHQARKKSPTSCCFCGSAHVRLRYPNAYHRHKADHGPFDFYECSDCGAGLTLPPPDPARLTSLYSSFVDGYPEALRSAQCGASQGHLYEFYIDRLCSYAGRDVLSTPFSWAEIGAGGGEFAERIARRFPRSQGLAVDLHPKPAPLGSVQNVSWEVCDLNDGDFAAAWRDRFDIVISNAVWEHVLHPEAFARAALSMLKPRGLLFLICPDYGSVARRIMGKRWPYFSAGEHLNMPTPRAAVACVQNEWNALPHATERRLHVQSASVWLPYNIRYVLTALRVPFGNSVPAVALPLPVGALETVARVTPR